MPNKQQSIVLGGLVAGLLSTSYLGFINFLCCLGVIVGAVIAVWHYTDNNELTIKPGQGAMMGVLAALVGWAVAFVLNFVLIKIGIRHDLAITQFMIDKFGESMPPESYDQLIEQMETEITIGKYVLNGLIGIPISAIFGAIGGAIGAAIFKKGPDEDSTILAGE
jgi:putative flippase GtrA